MPWTRRIAIQKKSPPEAPVLAWLWVSHPERTAVARGREIAWRHGCFGCHGPYGMGGMPNPGSFKGMVPGWDGNGLQELVKGNSEFREWVLEGRTKRLGKNTLASFFLNGQTIKMPAYNDHLKEWDVKALWAYVRWVRGLDDTEDFQGRSVKIERPLPFCSLLWRRP